jgi:hypothetical protein
MAATSEQSGLLDLPNELLIPIFKDLPSSDLLSLAFLSRRLHLLVLPAYLASIGVLDDHQYSQSNISLHSKTFPALGVLRKSLYITSVAHLCCHFPTADVGVLREVREIHRFVSRLSSIDEVTLEFDRYYSRRSNIALTEWTTAFGDLLKSVSDKSCKSLTLRYGDHPSLAFAPVKPDPFKRKSPWPSIIINKCRKFLGKDRLVSVINFHLSLHPEIAAFASSNVPISIVGDHAKAVLPLNALTGSRITNLTLQYMKLSPQIWAAILSCITLPALARLHVSSCHIAFADLASFLSRHPTISALEFRYVGTDQPSSHSLKFTLPNLRELTAELGLVAFLLSAKLPSLESVSIPLNFTYKSHEKVLAEFSRVFAGVGNRKNQIALHLEISMDFDTNDGELPLVKGEKDGKIEPWQYLVKTVAFNTSVRYSSLTEAKLVFLPQWLGRWFVALEEVSVGHCCTCLRCAYHVPSTAERDALKQMLRDACPNLKIVIMNGIKYPA